MWWSWRPTPATGETRIDRYVMVNDFGVVVNPLIKRGPDAGRLQESARR